MGHDEKWTSAPLAIRTDKKNFQNVERLAMFLPYTRLAGALSLSKLESPLFSMSKGKGQAEREKKPHTKKGFCDVGFSPFFAIQETKKQGVFFVS
mmetsp:Transcript_26511/g.61717  ORF Transcript_26511/g.61717 Transcript_26511/m.61717 type:complete len:95 (+) Transcript_26511:103-387(+)